MVGDETAAESESSERRAYATLDGLRGVAALVVVFFHFASDVFAPHGYLAVDLFFAMSGFVIASAYERRLRGGLGACAFLGIRMRRLAPLWALAVLVGLALELVIPSAGGARNLALLTGLGLLLAPSALTFDAAFPMNASLWSLHVELVVNLLYAALRRLLTTRVLLGVAAASLIALVGVDSRIGAFSSGVSQLDLASGYLRALVSFPIGIVLWRIRARLPKPKFGALSLLIATALLLTGIGVPPVGVWGICYDLAFVILAAPVLVILAVANEPAPRLRGLFTAMGSGSYALYTLHEPILQAARRFASDHGGVPTYLTIGVVMIPGIVLIAWSADRFLDAPVRRWLVSTTAARPAPAAAASA